MRASCRCAKAYAQVRTVIWDLFKRYGTPAAMAAAHETEVARIIKPLGLVKRAKYLTELSRQYQCDSWTDVRQLMGIGCASPLQGPSCCAV